MKLFDFLSREAGDAPHREIVAMTAVSSVATMLLLVLTNLGAEYAADGGGIRIELAVGYLVVFGVLLESRGFALTQSVTAVERGVLRVRLRVIDKVRRADLRFIEQRGGVATYASLTQDVGLISQAVVFLVPVAESVLILLFVGLYLGWLSPPSLLAVLAIYSVTLPVYLLRFARTRDQLRRAATADGSFLEQFVELLHGFKELKLNRRESDAFYTHLVNTGANAVRMKLASSERQTNDVIYAGSILYLALLAVAFAIPALVPEASATVYKVAAAVLFMIAPLTHLVNGAPTLAKADAAVSNLYALEERLDEALTVPVDAPPPMPLREFESIQLQGVGFRFVGHDGRHEFLVGPLDFRLNRGERIFVAGANGSGKTTLIKLLTGLYRPESGEVLLDGTPVADADQTRYRSLFASVFDDFQLFERIYGIADLEPELVNEWLADLGLGHKTRYSAAGYSTIELSTGQRKRLAFLESVLKGRPICVFDELAADQDPGFRRRLYEELLPRLSASGRTLVIVSHDDQYFHTADRLVEMRDGQLAESSWYCAEGRPQP
ncbi:MAG: cyclic peptide export ABC transporter [Thiohalocapsa sp.]